MTRPPVKGIVDALGIPKRKVHNWIKGGTHVKTKCGWPRIIAKVINSGLDDLLKPIESSVIYQVSYYRKARTKVTGPTLIKRSIEMKIFHLKSQLINCDFSLIRSIHIQHPASKLEISFFLVPWPLSGEWRAFGACSSSDIPFSEPEAHIFILLASVLGGRGGVMPSGRGCPWGTMMSRCVLLATIDAMACSGWGTVDFNQ